MSTFINYLYNNLSTFSFSKLKDLFTVIYLTKSKFVIIKLPGLNVD